MGIRILVVDDEVVVLGAVTKALKKTEYVIDTAQSAEEALSLLARARYDVVVTDLMLPELSGLQLMERMRDMEVRAETILITGYPSVQSALRAKKLGAFEYVTKPFTRQELLSVVVRAVRCEKEATSLVAATEVPDRHYVIPDHGWARIEPDRTARIGMAQRFASATGGVVDLELPAEDDLVEQGRMCVVIRAEDGVEHYLNAPLSGRVLEVNERLESDPELAIRDPHGEGWLLRIEPQDEERELGNLVRLD
jgi:CheY-like chemotaxis protein/glycine cleavage system H lipoate-binding protein